MKKLFLVTGMLLLLAFITNAQQVAKRSGNLTAVQTALSLKALNTPGEADQTTLTNVKRNCGTIENQEYLKSQDPAYAAKLEQLEAFTENWIKNNPNYESKAVVTIPVVVHVVYNGSAQNISDARVQEQIDVLNRDYAGLNTHSMNAFSTTLKSNTELQFCLAKRTPAGLTTTGIDRKSTTVTSFSTNNNIKHASTGGADIWDATKYMNIWVGNLGGGLCGYAEFPVSGLSTTYGVVINYQYFGVTGASAPYNLGGTTTHEIGHCFNLYHIWGDDGGSCTSGTDQCTDTPNQGDATYGNHNPYNASTNPGGNFNGTGQNSTTLTDGCATSSPGVMYENFMDYTDDVEYANFTPNQKTRIQACFATGGALAALKTSNGCTPVGGVTAPVADFSANATNITPGTTVSFTDLSTNTPTSWSWTFGDGGTSTLQNPTHLYSAVGTYTVVLTATNTAGSNAKTKTNYIIVNTATAGCDTLMPTSFTTPTCSLAVYVQDAITPYDSGYICGQNAWLDKEKAMMYTGVAGATVSDVFVMYPIKGGTGNTSVKIYSSTSGAPGTLLGTSAIIAKSAIDTTSKGVNLHNKYHFSTPVNAAADFFVSVVLPTGFTNTTNTLAIWASTYTCTSNTEYEMWSDNSWNDFTTVYGSNIDMAIFPIVCTTVGDNEIALLENNVHIFPNPTSDQFTVLFTGEKQKDVLINIYNAMGSLVKSVTSNNITDNVIIDMNDVAKGIYIVNIKTPQGTIIKKLSLIK